MSPSFFSRSKRRHSDRLVADIVNALVFDNVLRQRLHGPVRRGKSDIQKERLIAVLLAMLANEAAGLVSDCIRVVIRLPRRRAILRINERTDGGVSAAEQSRIKETAGSHDGAVIAIESAMDRPIAFVGRVRRDFLSDMPFADGIRAIAR